MVIRQGSTMLERGVDDYTHMQNMFTKKLEIV